MDMNGIYDLRIDLDRLKHFEEKQDDYKVNEYKGLIIKHANELVYDQDPFSKELQVKEILSKEIFEKMSDQGAAQVLRSILLADRNIGDRHFILYRNIYLNQRCSIKSPFL